MIRRTALKRCTPLKRSTKPLKKSPIIKQRPKEKNIKQQLSSLKKEIELKEVQDNTYYCKGCGISMVGLDKSHILSIGQFKHLELVKKNIQLLCRSCHRIWENGTIEEKMALLCFNDNLEIIKELDIRQYVIIINSINK